MEKRRILYLDILRVMATVAVILLHVSSEHWGIASLDSIQWHICNLGDSITRWAPPIFVMISGAVFLNPEKKISIKSLYTKNIFRLCTAFVFWSVLYAVKSAADFSLTATEVLVKIICGHWHMWFLHMIIGLYVMVPILRAICQNALITKYFIITSFFLNIAAYTIFNVIAPFVNVPSFLPSSVNPVN